MLVWIEAIPDWGIVAFAVLVGLFIGLIIRRENKKRLLQEIITGQRKPLLRLYRQPYTNSPLYHPQSPLGEGISAHFLPNEQYQEQGTSRKAHEL